ncbi:hypothetical protein G9464_18760 [Halostella sp. JP-L12]|uniref:hypothetical protein n=1 Tax=Halostella TaxID=1843185 RepID=UPI000EF7F700|nr:MULTISPECIES: hypothetical protein [Halostella]NHN49613.1 hypothetical protein [Halostella sp. JP-L12]
MYTGKTEKPCCLCDDPSISARIDLPPRAVQLLKHSDPIAWRDIVGEVSIYFCADDWETVKELVLETGMSPLSRCNVARASFDLREDFEALLNETRAEPDQRPVEREFRERSDAALADPDAASERELVEARVVRWALKDLADEA